jgi:hypothetical protein
VVFLRANGTRARPILLTTDEQQAHKYVTEATFHGPLLDATVIWAVPVIVC